MSEILKCEISDRIAVLTLNDGATRNALSDAMVDALIAAIDRINDDPDISCVILTAAGPTFCSGGNLKEMRDGVGMFGGSPQAMRDAYRRQIQRLPRAMHGLEVPAIAAVDGPAVGAGCDLAMMCDVRVVSPRASFAESFLRVGLVSGDGGAWFLPRVVGRARAYEMAFTAEPVSGEQAIAWGAASRIAEPDALLDEARSLARLIVRHPPQALRLMKRLMREGAESSLEQCLELSAFMQATAQYNGDFREAVAAALEKRPPEFTGR